MFWPDDERRLINTKKPGREPEPRESIAARKKRREDEEIAHANDARARAERMSKASREMTEGERDWLASELCLPMRIFDLLPVRYLEDNGHGRGNAYIMPEMNADGVTVGLHLRYHDNSKQTYGTGGEIGRGLIIPDGWHETTGPIVIPEGMSDTLGLTAMNIAAVGRPSNTGGVDIIAALLIRAGVAGDETRQIIIMAENDRKEDGTWPGRDGADKTAKKLSDLIGRPVHVAYPPPGYKDIRDYVTANKTAIIEKKKSLREIGYQLIQHITATAQPCGDRRTSEVISVIFGWSPGDLAAFTPLSMQDPPPYVRIEASETYECPHSRGVIMRHHGNQQTRVIRASCKRLNCEHCGPIKRQQYTATVSERVLAWEKNAAADGPPPTLTKFYCEESDWHRVSAHIYRERAEYFRLDLGDGNFMVITTASEPASIEGARQLLAPEAIRDLSNGIKALPTLREKVFTSSRGWKLVDDTKSPVKGWVREGAFSCSWNEVVNIMEYNRIHWEVVGHRGRFWGWSGCQFENAGLNIEHIDAQLRIGQAMPEFDFDFDGTDSDRDDDLATVGAGDDDSDLYDSSGAGGFRLDW